MRQAGSALPAFAVHAADRGFCGVFSPNAEARRQHTGDFFSEQ